MSRVALVLLVEPLLEEGPELIEQGERFDRPYEERQRYPGDAEACEGMGPITNHAAEHLAPSDKGVALMRRRLRDGGLDEPDRGSRLYVK